MRVYDSLRQSEDWLPIQFSILLSIYPYSRWLKERYIISIFCSGIEHFSCPLTFSKLQSTFVREKRCDIRKRFHNDCVILSESYRSTFYEEYCATEADANVTLCNDKDNWWCDFCNRPLFKNDKLLVLLTALGELSIHLAWFIQRILIHYICNVGSVAWSVTCCFIDSELGQWP